MMINAAILKKTSLLIIAVVFSLVLSSCSTISVHDVQTPLTGPIKVIAHRGASSYAPENTMAAFRKAIEMNVDYIELDVQLSKDGFLVVIHDTTVNRTTDGSGKVKEMSLKALKKLDAGSFFSSEFVNEKIPTLDEVLGLAKGKVGVVIELKEPAEYPGVLEALADVLNKHNMDKETQHEVIVQSFDAQALQNFHSIMPTIPLGILVGKRNGQLTNQELAHYADFAQFINPHHSLVKQESVQQIHGYGMQVMAWTVRVPGDVSNLLAAKTDGLITDYLNFSYQ